MLWAIDVGNTQTVVAIHDGSSWIAHWRQETDAPRTEDEIAASLWPLVQMAGIPFEATGVMIASVVPPVEANWVRFSSKYLKQEALFLRDGASVGIPVDYRPANAVGADRIANALAVADAQELPAIVVDFGTATTFDCIGSDGTYLGGSIMPGILVSLSSLVGRTAKLPAVAIEAPAQAIGKDTVGALQSGVVLGYAGAVDTLITKLSAEFADQPKVLATGGLGKVFVDLCEKIDRYEAMLTMDGLRIAYGRLRS